MSARLFFPAVSDARARAAFAAAGAAAGEPPDTDPVDGAVSLALAGPEDAPLARASLWLAHDLVGAPGRSGLVGHYAAADAEAGAALLRAACAELSRRGVARVLGPMNGSTWRRYRLELPREAGDEDLQPARFAGEPVNPPRWNDDFTAAGFRVAWRYESRYEPELAVDAAALARARERAAASGLRVSTLAPEHFAQALRAMHTLSLEAFAANHYYSPLSLEDFLDLYAPFRARLAPGMVHLAHRPDGRLAGYAFGYPDPLSVEDGRPSRFVCKTLAVAKEARGAGLGGLLLDECRASGVAFGARGMMHALMSVDNASMRLSEKRRSVTFKRYALYGWEP